MVAILLLQMLLCFDLDKKLETKDQDDGEVCVQ